MRGRLLLSSRRDLFLSRSRTSAMSCNTEHQNGEWRASRFFRSQIEGKLYLLQLQFAETVVPGGGRYVHVISPFA